MWIHLLVQLSSLAVVVHVSPGDVVTIDVTFRRSVTIEAAFTDTVTADATFRRTVTVDTER